MIHTAGGLTLNKQAMAVCVRQEVRLAAHVQTAILGGALSYTLMIC